MLTEALERVYGKIKSTRGPGDSGMGTIHLHCNPYGSKWQAYASWSNDQRVYGEECQTPLEAVESLEEMLETV